ncbi:hypothetical protein VCRA2128O305_100091 [Vibrio crassostreae]|nr:hypothetical protein VCRA2113O221_100081 [Vibrio crassostreae]CAK1701183.1 hypothetical protein VCRA2113O196_100091 [Vibrio crassostreae]CAK1701230.1 hypothetical protein VCRA2118O239_100092 [Vibrio crassostreae]CAK1701891.1 hypothetical protein VCRA2112O185_100093 [Vibrio crassostreae]CAK1768644.1 hypothetical protein VCRA2113O218_150013 [Vibrio crassostreae]
MPFLVYFQSSKWLLVLSLLFLPTQTESTYSFGVLAVKYWLIVVGYKSQVVTPYYDVLSPLEDIGRAIPTRGYM